jgi:predicted permease
LQQDSDSNMSWSFLEFSNPAQKLKEIKDQLPSPEDLNPFSSVEEGEYPNVTPYPTTSSNNETQPLLTKQRAKRVSNNIGGKLKSLWESISEYLNPPMMGGGVAVILGLIPFMRHALFDNTGFLSPIAESIKNLGKLYTVLQMFVLGAHLYSKQGGRPAVLPMIYLLVVRFAVMTALGCGAVYGMRQWLGSAVKEDPVLVSDYAGTLHLDRQLTATSQDFILILIPVGPPALTLAAVSDRSRLVYLCTA